MRTTTTATTTMVMRIMSRIKMGIRMWSYSKVLKENMKEGVYVKESLFKDSV